MKKVWTNLLASAGLRAVWERGSKGECYVVSHVEGAYANDSRITKVVQEDEDAHPVGAMATVIGSVGPIESGEFGYFVRWDDMPDVAVFVRGRKIRLSG